MTRDELIAAARAACAAWWDTFGGSADPEGEWDGLDDTECDYWCHVADSALSAAVLVPQPEDAQETR